MYIVFFRTVGNNFKLSFVQGIDRFYLSDITGIVLSQKVALVTKSKKIRQLNH